MMCKGCHSNKQSTFNGEIAVQFPGREGLDKSLVFVFPKIIVCFHCGFTEFTVPERELQILECGSSIDGAAVLTEKVNRIPKTKEKSTSPGAES